MNLRVSGQCLYTIRKGLKEKGFLVLLNKEADRTLAYAHLEIQNKRFKLSRIVFNKLTIFGYYTMIFQLKTHSKSHKMVNS